jgi:adenylate kinase
VGQADALGEMLTQKHLTLNAVIELVVDQDKLVDRIVKRAADAQAAGQPVRKDDDPAVFKTRLAAYNRDTAIVSPYYEKKGMLTRVDGMQDINAVTALMMKALD